MATRSSIGIELENGNVLSIYCHWDGYPSGNGKILHDYYRDRIKIMELINLGNISYLEREVNPPDGSNHSFDYPLPNVTVSYHRDRGEEYRGPEKFESPEIFSQNFGQSWAYLFNKNNQWMVTRGSGKYASLSSLLETDTD